jgi:hypothetical protein
MLRTFYFAKLIKGLYDIPIGDTKLLLCTVHRQHLRRMFRQPDMETIPGFATSWFVLNLDL